VSDVNCNKCARGGAHGERALLRAHALLAASLLLPAGVLMAQEYPNRVVRIVVADTAGSSSDNSIRLLSQKLTAEWGEQIVVDNRPGANGIIGAQAVASAKPDGYTLLNGSPNMLSINRAMYKKLPYDSLRDFAPVGQIATNHFAFVVPASLPARSVPALVKLAKSRPDEMLFASSGVGNQNHLSVEIFARAAGIKVLHVPHKGTTPALTSLMSGEVTMMITSASAVASQVTNGKLRLLAMAGTRRAAAFPNTPTLVESGYPQAVIMGWSGLLAPAGTPAGIVNKLSRDLGRLLMTADVRSALSDQGREVTPSTPEAFGALIRAEAEKWEKIVRAVGLENSQ